MNNSKYKLLVLTDHADHTSNNSLYELARAMAKNPLCKGMDITSRSVSANKNFFYDHSETLLEVVRVTPEFRYEPDGSQFSKKQREALLAEYDAIFIRLPQPADENFFDFLTLNFDEKRIVNRPSGILEAGSKAFLLNLPEFCPPMALCKDLHQVENFTKRFPVVLKPLFSYGGKGLIKVDGFRKFSGDEAVSHAKYLKLLEEGFRLGGWLGMKFLKNVKNGDKRIVVVNREIVGASLRLPGKDSWLCNVAQGGSSGPTEPTPRELELIDHLTPTLLKKGVVMYGIDTLEDDNGKRVLSEINAMSIGGLTPMEKMYNKPIIQNTSNLLWNYIGKYIPIERPLKR